MFSQLDNKGINIYIINKYFDLSLKHHIVVPLSPLLSSSMMRRCAGAYHIHSATKITLTDGL